MVPALILLCFSRCFRACCCLPVFLSLTAVGVACFRFVVVHHALVSIVSFPSCCSLLSSPWRYHNLSSCDPAAIHWIPEDWRNWYLCAMVGRGFRGSTAQRALWSRASCTRFCRMSKHRFRHLSAVVRILSGFLPQASRHTNMAVVADVLCLVHWVRTCEAWDRVRSYVRKSRVALRAERVLLCTYTRALYRTASQCIPVLQLLQQGRKIVTSPCSARTVPRSCCVRW